MATHVDRNILNNVLSKFSKCTSAPENFLTIQNGLFEDFKSVTKDLYDLGIKSLTSGSKPAKLSPGVLPELLVDGFDEEQIWQELELNNSVVYSSCLKTVSRLVDGKKKLSLRKVSTRPVAEQPSEDHQDLEEDKSDAESVASKVTLDGDFDDEGSESEGSGDLNFSAFDDAEESDDGEDVTQQKREKTKKNVKQTEVDDQFFKLREMEAFLDREDRRDEIQNRNAGPGDEEDQSDESSIDYFQDIPSEDEDDEEESGRNAKYSDFFGDEEPAADGEAMDSDEIEDEQSVDGEDEEDDGSKRVRFNLDEDSEEGEDLDDIFEGKKAKPTKSPFEERQERLKARIEDMENEALSEKSWQLLGETNAENRPENALLEEDLMFDHTTRQAPVVTEETTKTLEDIIRRRIKDAAYDDVERKVKPVADPREYKKKLVLDQEKSKFSLAELYEQEYLKAQEAQQQQPSASLADPMVEKQSDDANHAVIRKMMNELFSHLDALSNFHYTPKMPAPEIKIVSNMPSITMEEVAPVAVSDANLLAPEEVAGRPRGEVKGADERDKTDKLRERRKKKAKQHEKQQLRQNLEKSLPADKKRSKNQVLRHLQQAEKDGTVTLIKGKGNNPLKSSTAFFSQLQDTVSAEVQALKGKGKGKSDRGKPVSAHKLKL